MTDLGTMTLQRTSLKSDRGDQGSDRIIVFFKAAPYDRRAHIVRA